jgi:hypothetical protein
MQQAGALEQRSQGGRLGPRFSRLLHHRQAALWFALLAVAGLAQFVSFLIIDIPLFVTMGQLGYNTERLSTTLTAVALALSLVVAPAVAFYVYRTQRATFFDPPKNRIPRKSWHGYANGTGAAIALPAAWAVFLMWIFILIGLTMAVRLIFPSFGTRETPLGWLVWAVPVAGPTLWGFVAWRHVALEVLETAEPPELRLAAHLKQHVEAFQERAQALEDAFEEAEAISKKVQRGIESEQEQLRELREQYRLHAQLIELSDHAPAVRTAIAQEQTRASRWGLLVNVLVAAVFYVIGLLTDALVDTEALGHQLRQWFHLG